MLWFLLACTSTPTTPSTAGWEERLLYRAAPQWVVGAEDALLAVGESGLVVDIATGWTELGGEGALGLSAAAVRDGDLWAAGRDDLGHFVDGWEITALPQFHSAQALALDADGLPVVLDSHVDCEEYCTGTIVHNDLLTWNGAAWTIARPPMLDHYLMALASTDEGQLIAAGEGGLIATWEDGAWALAETGTTASLADLVIDGTALVAVGTGGTVLRGSLDAPPLETLPLETLELETVGDENLVAAAIGTDGSTWVLGESKAWRDDGSGWQAVDLPEGDWADLATSPDGVVVVGKDLGPVGLAGDAGGLAEAWRLDSIDWPTSCWVDPEGTVWLSSASGMVGRWTDDALEVEQVEISYDYAELIAGGTAQDVLMVGHSTLWSYDGITWTQQDVLSDGDSVQAAAVADDGTAYAGGSHFLYDAGVVGAWWRRVDGDWEVDPVPLPEGSGELTGVLVFSANNVVAVEYSPIEGYSLLRFDGESWTVIDALVDPGFFSAWGTAADDLWLLGGSNGTLLQHWDGSALSEPYDVPGALDYQYAAPNDHRRIMGSGDELLVTGHDREVSDGRDQAAWEYLDGTWSQVLRSEDLVRGCAGDKTWALYDGTWGWRRSL
ncbi:MAG: hypothetical protein GXP62_12825 [Oligoflexia bacterium]|nr:hypothetical protein [Oligoflexia bacterium]